MSALAIVGAIVTLLSTLGAIFVSLWGAKVQARSKAAEAQSSDRAASNETIEIGHKVLIDGIEWSQTQLSDLRTANAKLQSDLNESNAKRLAAERRLLREAREKSELTDRLDEAREKLNTLQAQPKEPPHE